MANFLVLQVRNIPGELISLDAATAAGVAFNGGALQTPVPTEANSPGQLQIEIPPGTTHIRALVSPPDYFSASQRLNFAAGNPPRFSFDSYQQTNIGLPTCYMRDGRDWVITLPIILGQLKDGTPNVSSTFFARPTTELDLIGHPCLSPSEVLNQRRSSVALQRGTLYLFERVHVPKLIAVWKPEEVSVRNWSANNSGIANSEGSTPLDYHLFYPPNPPRPWAATNPFANIYLNFVRRFFFVSDPYDSIFDKAMVYRHAAVARDSGGGRKMPIFVFPVKMHGVDIGDMQSKSSVYRLLLEINFLLQRLARLPEPTHPVGRVALSGFSFGGSHVRRVLESGRSRLSAHLREVYAFDFVSAGAQNAVRRWFNRDRGSRMMRIYSSGQNDSIRSIMAETLDEVRSPIFRLFGAAEAHATNASVVYAPSGFWETINPNVSSQLLFARVHQMIPAIFMSHALSQSGFH